jgi:hypothetical protein
MAPHIQSEVKTIKEDLGQKASDSRLLVQFEAKLENVKNVERQRLMNEYNDMVEWLMMLNRNPRQKQLDESIKPVILAYTQVDDIVNIIEASEAKLKAERTEIENSVIEQAKNFEKDLA